MTEASGRYCAIVRYDGRGYFGWQRHPGRPTVQGALEQAVETCAGARSAVQAAGRTDRGAHALGQAVSFSWPANAPEPGELGALLNGALPPSIRVLSVASAPEDFEARVRATSKVYEYRIANTPVADPQREGLVWFAARPLQLSSMERAARILPGTHDFSTFATKQKSQRRDNVRRLSEARVWMENEEIWFSFRADGFLNHMVRNMVHALARVGEGKDPPKRIAELLAAKKRGAASGTAPASGLYLKEVRFAKDQLGFVTCEGS